MMASKGKCVLNFDTDYSSALQFIVSTAEYKEVISADACNTRL